MPQVTHTIKVGTPLVVEGVTIELQHTGTHTVGTQTAETAIVVVTTED